MDVSNLNKRWSEKEINYLMRFYAYQPLYKTAKKLKRTKRSIQKKAASIGLHRYTESLTAKSLAKCFHSDVSVVIRWINKFNLPCKISCYGNQHRYFIEIDNFWKWAEQHKQIINWKKYESESLPPDPDWVKEEKTKVMNNKNRQPISIYDKQKFKRMVRQGFTYQEIAKEMGRTLNSVKHMGRTLEFGE